MNAEWKHYEPINLNAEWKHYEPINLNAMFVREHFEPISLKHVLDDCKWFVFKF